MEHKIATAAELVKKPYLNEKEVATITGKALSTLRNDRHCRRGIPYLKVGKRSVRYKNEDVINSMEERRITFNGPQSR